MLIIHSHETGYNYNNDNNPTITTHNNNLLIVPDRFQKQRASIVTWGTCKHRPTALSPQISEFRRVAVLPVGSTRLLRGEKSNAHMANKRT